MSVENQREISRRSIAKGAAWAAPAVALGAAAPSLAASPVEECDDCITSIATVAATNFARLVNPGTVTIAGGITFSMLGCTGLLAAGLVTVDSATLTVSRRSGADSTHTTSLNLSLGASAAGLVVLPSALSFTGVNIPSGLYAGFAGIGLTPSWPSQLCLNIRYFRLIGGVQTECSQQLCLTPSLAAVTVGAIPGTVVFATVWS